MSANDPCRLRRDQIPHGDHIVAIPSSGDANGFASCPGFRLTEQQGGPPNDDAIMVGERPEQAEQDRDSTQAERDREVLTDWWVGIAAEEVRRVVPKAVEYGSTDLIEIGRTLAATQHRFGLTEAEQAELGVYFYIVGKMARWTDAVKAGRPVSDDTLHDIGVYVRMAQRIRQVGGWPFGQDDTPTAHHPACTKYGDDSGCEACNR